MTTSIRSLALAGSAGFGLSLLSALPAGAHTLPATTLAGSALAAGVLHPLMGLDHLLLLVGLAALVTRAERRLLWPALLGAGLGALLGVWGWALPGQESLAALAVAALGGLLLLVQRLRRAGAALRGLAAAVVAAATVVHALLHGQEASADPSWWLGASLAAIAVFAVATLVLRRSSDRSLRGLALLLGGSGLLLALAPLL